MITLLTVQLNYLFSTMDENLRRTIDYCTQTYIERILMLKPQFSAGMQGLLSNKLQLTQDAVNRPIMKEVMGLIDTVLKGRYTYVDGEERLQLDNGKYVKINFASSGQQEAVWIFNLIFYYLLENKPIFFILEEPESRLYPDAQKLMAEMMGLLLNAGHSALITTHSPYVLGTWNNLLLAQRTAQVGCARQVEKVLSPNKWLQFEQLSAYYVTQGKLSSCLEAAYGMIKNEVIDDASLAINEDSDALYNLLLGAGEGDAECLPLSNCLPRQYPCNSGKCF